MIHMKNSEIFRPKLADAELIAVHNLDVIVVVVIAKWAEIKLDQEWRKNLLTVERQSHVRFDTFFHRL